MKSFIISIVIVFLVFDAYSQTQHFSINFIIVNPDKNQVQESDIRKSIVNLNKAFKGTNICFHKNNKYEIIYNNGKEYYDTTDLREIYWLHNFFNFQNEKINVYITDKVERQEINNVVWEYYGTADLPNSKFLAHPELNQFDSNIDITNTDANNSIYLYAGEFIKHKGLIEHEMGHFFGLFHTFQGLGSVEVSSLDCYKMLGIVNNFEALPDKFDDFIFDTPPIFRVDDILESPCYKDYWLFCNLYGICTEPIKSWINNDIIWKNFMQYNHKNERNSFSTEQKDTIIYYKNKPERTRLSSYLNVNEVLLPEFINSMQGDVNFSYATEHLFCNESTLATARMNRTGTYRLQVSKDLNRYFTSKSGYKDNYLDPVNEEIVVDAGIFINDEGKLYFNWTNTTSSSVYEPPISGQRYKATLAKPDPEDGGFVTFSDEIIFTVGEYECEETTGLSVSNISRDGAILSWNANADANNYTVHLGTNGVYNESHTTTTTSYNLTKKLVPNTNYCWYVETFCDGGLKQESNERCFSTNGSSTPIHTDGDLKISISWIETLVAANSSVSFDLEGTHRYTIPGTYDDVYTDVHLYLSTNNSLSGQIDDLGIVPMQLGLISSINEGTFNFNYTMNMERYVNASTLQKYYIIAIIDEDDEISETNEGNNFTSSEFYLVADVFGCTLESAHNYSSDASSDDGSCETCYDNIKNGNELGRDCGGSCKPCVPCPVVTNINHTTTNISADISWMDTDNRDNYSLSYRLQSESDYDQLYTTSQNVSLENLVPETQYCYKVTVHCFDIDIESAEICFTTGNHVDGCTNPSSHNYNIDATRDNGSCLTCEDGILNGDEIGLDCGGTLCEPCFCLNDTVYVDYDIYSNEYVKAEKDIIGSAKVLFNQTTFEAGMSVDLLDGFDSEYAFFDAQIADCDPNTYLVANKEVVEVGESFSVFYANVTPSVSFFGSRISYSNISHRPYTTHGKLTLSFDVPGVYSIKYDEKLAGINGIWRTKQEIRILVKSCEWYCYATDNLGKSGDYVDLCTIYNNGIASFDPSPPYTSNGSNYFPKYYNFKEFGIDGDNCKIEAKLKNEGDGGDQSRVTIFGSLGNAYMQLQDLFASGTYLSAGTTTKNKISSFIIDMSEWRTFGFETSNNTIRGYINDPSKEYQMNYEGNIGQILGIGIDFRGGGEIDWVRIYDDTNALAYEDDFDNCDYGCTGTFSSLVPDDIVYDKLINPEENNGQLSLSDISIDNQVFKVIESIKVMPNPALNYIELNGKESLMGYEIRLINTSGKELLQVRTEDYSPKIDISQYESGLYFLKISKDGLFSYKKFVKID